PADVLGGRRDGAGHGLREVPSRFSQIGVRHWHARCPRHRNGFFDDLPYEVARVSIARNPAVARTAQSRNRVVGTVHDQLRPEIGLDVARNVARHSRADEERGELLEPTPANVVAWTAPQKIPDDEIAASGVLHMPRRCHLSAHIDDGRYGLHAGDRVNPVDVVYAILK